MKGSKELIRDTLLKLDGISDNDEWVDLVDRYELDCSPDHLRKLAYGFRMYRDIMGEDSNETEELVKLKKERQKVSDLRVEAQKQIRNLARIENVIDLMKDEINDLSNNKPFISSFKLKQSSSGKDGILCLGDIHDFLVIDNSVNKYNHEICIRRLNDITDKTIEYGLINDIDKLHIIGLGDYISGTIHNSLKLINQEEIAHQIVNTSEVLAQCIAKLAEHFYCTVTITIGNHEAIEMSKDDRRNKNNYTKLIKEFLKLRLDKHPNVIFLENTFNDNEVALLKVKNLNIAACHGDKINRNKVKEQLEMVTNTELDMILYAHIHNHQRYTLYNTEVFVNGSLCGSDEYAMGKKLCSPPSQTMIIVDENGVLYDYVIKVK